jgi:hypothetical protein
MYVYFIFIFICNILRPFGIFCGHYTYIFYGRLVHFSMCWYVAPRKIWQPWPWVERNNRTKEVVGFKILPIRKRVLIRIARNQIVVVARVCQTQTVFSNKWTKFWHFEKSRFFVHCFGAAKYHVQTITYSVRLIELTSMFLLTAELCQVSSFTVPNGSYTNYRLLGQ